jgi:hypothetical protein
LKLILLTNKYHCSNCSRTRVKSTRNACFIEQLVPPYFDFFGKMPSYIHPVISSENMILKQKLLNSVWKSLITFIQISTTAQMFSYQSKKCSKCMFCRAACPPYFNFFGKMPSYIHPVISSENEKNHRNKKNLKFLKKALTFYLYFSIFFYDQKEGI